MAKTADFLVEIGTEELPPRALRRLERAFGDGVREGIAAAGLKSGEQKSFATPRRLALRVDDLELQQPARAIEKRGPSIEVAFDGDGNPAPAGLAFAKSCRIEIQELDRMKTDKGEWLLFRSEQPGAAAMELLPEIVDKALAALPIPKRMRWGTVDVEFVRPVHWVLMLLGKHVVDAEILGTRADRLSRGHRFHAPAPINISKPSKYPQLLRDTGFVVADFAERRELIRTQAEKAAAELNGRVILDEQVLDEVTALTEWPVAVTGAFATEYLRLPEEVLIATLQDHQRYFPMRASDGSLLANFVAVSNLDSNDFAQVRQGNERVVAPRLADAAFFWDQDRRVTLESRRAALENVVFQQALGSLHDKSARVARLATQIAEETGEDASLAQRSAGLAKTDLLTQMVGEFPELQGRVGYYYALEDGEPADVAAAIEEQYLPRQAGGSLPSTRLGAVLALADRFDTLAGIFATGRKPSGNKDPFGLRRSALAILRILIEQDIDLDLGHYIELSIKEQPVDGVDVDKLSDELYDFMIDRLRAYCLDGQAPNLKAGAVTPEIFESVRAHRVTSAVDFHRRLEAVCQFMQMDSAESLAVANKRIANILKSAAEDFVESVDPELFEEDEERALFEAVGKIQSDHAQDLAAKRYTEILERLANLREPVDRYFDTVMVMADDADQRRNRLSLMQQLRQLFLDVADLSRIPAA